MDSCAGTNKSQFFDGGLGLKLSVGLLDCAMVVYMVVGHTNFRPDLVARQIAGVYNSSDAFNHGQSVPMMTPYATAGAYDDSVLHTWKLGTERLFAPIAHIMSYRCLLLIADDGHVQTGVPVKVPSSDFEPFDDPGALYEDEVLMRECERAAARSLTNVVLPSLRTREYHGIGRAAVADHRQGPDGALLLPAVVDLCNRVRLFTRGCAEDPYWREQEGWIKDCSVDSVNACLAAVEPYKGHPELHKEAYGAKAKGIREQYANYVPPEFVPDRFEVPDGGHTGRLFACVRRRSIRASLRRLQVRHQLLQRKQARLSTGAAAWK